jgi:hypothetical protein
MTYEEPTTPGTSPTPGARRSPRQGVGGSPVGSTLSIVLAVVAVVAGFLILNNITDDESESDGGAEVSVTTSSIATVVTTPTETTEPPLVFEGATVIVANASGVPGSAGRMSDELTAAGFTMATATNATTPLEQSVVYADPANAAAQAVAESVARTMGGLTVEPIPTPPPVEGESIGAASVLVMLGTAQADQTLAQLATPAAVAPPPVAGTGSVPATGSVPGTTDG